MLRSVSQREVHEADFQNDFKLLVVIQYPEIKSPRNDHFRQTLDLMSSLSCETFVVKESLEEPTNTLGSSIGLICD